MTAGRPSKGELMTFESMVDEQDKVKKTRVYKTDKSEALAITQNSISQTVANALEEMKQAETHGKIKLEDIRSVKAQTELYLLACIQKGTVPTMNGLARCLGYTRTGLYWHINHKKDETSQWLEQFQDMCSDILAQNSLLGNTHPIVSIFLQKAMYNLKDNLTVETINHNDDRYSDNEDIESIKSRWRQIIESNRQCSEEGSKDWSRD